VSDATLSVDGDDTRTRRASAGLAARLARRAALAALPHIQGGRLTAHLPDGSVHRGGDERAGRHATVWIDDDAFFREFALRGDIGAGEAYMNGFWRADDLATFLEIALLNEAVLPQTSWLTRLLNVPGDLGHLLRRNTRAGSRRNIGAHYDLSNALFALFLDTSMSYSAAVYDTPGTSLEEAQARKYERLCEQLRLGPEHHVLEIGCGWGGFAEHAARTRGCRVTGVTISREQLAYAQARIVACGLDDRVTLRLCDYRDVTGQYSHIVSIEMLEAVGRAHWRTFFEVCERRLAPGGAVAVQSIAMPDHRFPVYARHADWIQKYIFPGGMLPSLGAICQAVTPETRLNVRWMEDIAPHYARTLVEWRMRFLERADEVRALGFDDRFVRMWEFYLASCEAMFRTRLIACVQFVLARTGEESVC
jgi:cyclopropane-fatty-acyl-phospholipid synthase